VFLDDGLAHALVVLYPESRELLPALGGVEQQVRAGDAVATAEVRLLLLVVCRRVLLLVATARKRWVWYADVFGSDVTANAPPSAA
jgi:hypothetical protein